MFSADTSFALKLIKALKSDHNSPHILYCVNVILNKNDEFSRSHSPKTQNIVTIKVSRLSATGTHYPGP